MWLPITSPPNFQYNSGCKVNFIVDTQVKFSISFVRQTWYQKIKFPRKSYSDRVAFFRAWKYGKPLSHLCNPLHLILSIHGNVIIHFHKKCLTSIRLVIPTWHLTRHHSHDVQYGGNFTSLNMDNTAWSVLFIPHSLFLIPYSILFIPYSLTPIPYS